MVAIASVEHPQCVLHLTLPSARQDNWLLLPGYVVTPEDLSRWIPKALSLGWKPSDQGPAFKLELDSSDLDPKRITDRRFN